MKRKISYFNWPVYIASFLMLGVLGVLPTVMFGGTQVIFSPSTRKYLVWYILYWLGMTIIFSIVTAYQKYAAFDKPMSQLSEATEQVAKGNFSVYLKPVHKYGRRDYIDCMFEDFNKMVEELGSIETLKNDFIADVSHEIKTPLAVIQNYITALQQEELSEEQKKEYLETIFESSRKFTKLVTNILKLNKLENQKIVPVIETYNLSRQLCDCVFAMEHIWDQKEIEVSLDIEERVNIRADESLAAIVWNNLLSNAAKFTDRGGTVTIVLKSGQNRVTVSVQDNGCGMDEHTRKHIFDKFYQGDSSHATAGNGLGMALAKKSIELLGGDIFVESTVGEGTRFQVELKKE